jgi:hypothetical protein
MVGQLKDLTANLDGSQNITVTVNVDFRETYDELHGKDINIEIKKYSKHRSLDANAYCWSIIDQIAKKLHMKKSEVYKNAIRDIGGVSDIVCVASEAVEHLCKGWEAHGEGWQTEAVRSAFEGFTNVTLWCGSSVYDSGQMSALIDSLKQDADALGIPTMTERETDRLLELWGKKNAKKTG